MNDTPLTPRQREVLALVAAGCDNPGIASRLFITRDTAKQHVSAILLRLGVTDRSATVAVGFKKGILE